MGGGGAEGHSSSQSYKTSYPAHLHPQTLLNNRELKKASVEDGVSKMQAAFPYAKGSMWKI